jgi:hypothetical protein
MLLNKNKRRVNMWEYIHTDELYHHGILGQRWGIRRFQNPDGSLTAAGRRRLSSTIEYDNKYNKFKKSLYDVKNKKSRSKLLSNLKHDPLETDIVTSHNIHNKNKLSKKEIKNITSNQLALKSYLKNNFKEIQKGKKIISKYGIVTQKPSIQIRKFNSYEEYKDYYSF